MDIRYILLTHGHFDHVCAANAIQQATGAEIIIGANDEHMLARPMTKSGLKAPGYNDDPVVPDRSVKEISWILVESTFMYWKRRGIRREASPTARKTAFYLQGTLCLRAV